MNENNGLEPVAALDRFFSVVREEAAANPTFARRLHDALGSTVKFQGSDATAAVDPVLMVRMGVVAFRESFLTFKPAELKKIMKDFGLAVPADFKGKTKTPVLVEMMWERASRKYADLTPSL